MLLQVSDMPGGPLASAEDERKKGAEARTKLMPAGASVTTRNEAFLVINSLTTMSFHVEDRKLGTDGVAMDSANERLAMIDTGISLKKTPVMETIV